MRKASVKRGFALVLCAILMLGSLPAIGSESFPFIGYTVDSLRLRQQASATAEVLIVIPKGEALAVSGAMGSYYIVEYQGRTGYAQQSYVTQTPPQAGEPLPLAQPASAALTQRYPQLGPGSQGEQVNALQMALKELNFYKGTLDGKYGSGTQSAVQAFQKMNKLPENGIADPVSQEKLFEGRPKNASGRETTVKSLPAIQGLTLRPGDRGTQVSELQQKLQQQGFYKGKLDGIYGPGTQSAVSAFQRSKGLKVDGRAGPNTLQALDAGDSQSPAQPTEAPQTGATPAPPYTPAAPAEAEATYPYTTTTSAAVNLRKRASVQAARILTVPLGGTISVISSSDGWVKASYKSYTGYLMSDYVNIPEQYLAGKTLPIDAAARQNYEPLALGASGPKVKALQQALQELGFYKGEVDSRFGAGTLAALKAFQEKNKLRPTGLALPELQQLLYEKRPRNARGVLVNLKILPPIPGYPMQSGDMGDAVLALNRGLAELGHLTVTPSNSYDSKTVSAVKAFQKAHSITQSGKMDSFTQLAFNTALGTGLKDQPTEAPYQGPTAPPLNAGNVIELRLGARGVAVTAMQQRLQTLGYYTAKIDGVFGGGMEAAIKAFQIKNQLLVTGIADLDTQIALNSASALPADLVSAPLPQVTPAPQQVLRIGSVGDAVVALQSRLIMLKYLSGKADGMFGTQTATAVTNFQRKSGLRADGIAGTQTLGALYGAKAAPNTAGTGALNPSAEEDSSALLTSLSLGDKGSQVRAMQQKLIDLMYLSGVADGIFGPKSFLALQAFQKNNRLQADGIAGKLTLAKLSDPRAIAAGGLSAVLPTPTPTPTPKPAGTPITGFTAPRASEVRFADWDTTLRSRTKSMPNVIVYDFMSGAHYNIKVFSVGRHADGEPPTLQDTQTMEGALGYNNWDPRPVWIIYSDGKVYMASTHSHGHEVDHTAGNGLTGHICIHFPRDMADAEATGPYAVAHQQAILAGWDLTQSMAK